MRISGIMWGAVCAMLLLLGTAHITMGKQKYKTTQTVPGSNPVKAPDDMDKDFMKHAAIGDAAEIGLGQMAQQKGSDPQVKQFGARMVKDHSTADDQLKGLAQSQQVSLPTSLDPEHEATKDRLSKLSGAQFDQAYIRTMVQDHTKTIDQFKREAQQGQDQSVKQFAQQSLPILESHLKEAQQIQSKLESSGK
jgi:putative membrane protein